MDRTNKIVAIAAIVAVFMGLGALPIAGQTNTGDYTVPVDGADAYTGSAQDVGTGAVDFIFVDGYNPWAAAVINAGDPDGVDLISVSYEADIDSLSIEISDSNSTNFAAVLVNKQFADQYIGESEDDMTFTLSDAVNYEGLDNSNASAGAGAVYVFMVEHFSTQTIEMTGQVDYTPPVDGAGSYTGVAENIGYGAVDFLFVEGYSPWAAMVVNAGDPSGIDMVTLSFDDEADTLKIELTDSNSTNHATVLVNKAFAEKYMGPESDLDFQLSDAVNYNGMQENNETAEEAVYVFQVEHFSTQTIEVSSASQEGIPSLGVFTVILLIAAVAVIVGIKRRY